MMGTESTTPVFFLCSWFSLMALVSLLVPYCLSQVWTAGQRQEDNCLLALTESGRGRACALPPGLS